MPATQHLLDDLPARWKRAGADADPKALLKAALLDLVAPLEAPLVVGDARPFVIMLAGVNGAGKTTSIGKLAKHLQGQGLSVLLAAGDTFRAAAREQLTVWGERNGVAVISQEGGDPAAVMFDADRRGPGARHRRRPRRHRRTPAHAAAPDGRDPQGPPGDPEGRPDGAARDPAGARRQHRAERAGAGEGVRRRAGADRARPDQARRHRQGRGGRRHRQAAPDPAQVHRRRRGRRRPAAVRRR